MTTNDKYIISEFYAFNPSDEVKNIIKEAEEFNKPIILTGILQKADTLNKNGRVYPFEILKREAAKYQELVKDRRALSEADHPDSAVVSLSNVSHMVTEMWWEDKVLKGKVQLLDTPAGNIIKGLLKGGVMLGISSRGVGSVKSIGGNDVVQEDFELIAFDFVSSPSTPGAYMFKEGVDKYKVGLKKLTNNDYKIFKAEDVDFKGKYELLKTLSEENFWQK